MKRNVRLIAVFLIVVQMFMLCDSCFALSTNESFLFKPVVIPLMNNSVKQWMNTPKNRATFTVLMAIEIDDAFEGFDGDAALANTSYIGNYNSDICVGLNDNEHSIFALYNYLQEEVTFIVTGYGDSDILNRPLIEKLCGKCYENDLNEINDVLLTVKTAIDASQGVNEHNSKPSKGEADALENAKSLLSRSAYSYTGLIELLEIYGFSNSEATYAANNCGADWNEQALKEAKSSLSNSSGYSYDGLIQSLEYDKFTSSQAKYGADHCGADWNEQAVIRAKAYVTGKFVIKGHSYKGLIAQMEYSGFTSSQAKYGADHCGADWNEQAVIRAKSYVAEGVGIGYSYKGLISQLEYHKFTSSQAKYGADHCGADWNEQAVIDAKTYVKTFPSWTKSQLKHQLEYDGYTSSEASYGVDNCGKSW